MSAGQKDHETRRIVSQILEDIRVGKEEAVRKYSLEMDGYDGKVIVSNEEIEEACNSLDPQLKEDIFHRRLDRPHPRDFHLRRTQKPAKVRFGPFFH